MTESRPFHLGDILSVATGIMCSPNGMDGIYNLCAWMTGDTPMTHQLPRFGSECQPAIYEQHPDLRAIVMPQLTSEADWRAWLSQMVAQYGEFRDITPMPEVDHTPIGPLTEFVMRRAALRNQPGGTP
ncbi:hypothetical protein BDK92_7144 [Micromonospora pisi]|uniref:DUF7736 domain-containing protein n=1 Tax=Micromonospora pisi TaxID=589240 RepID=A0A495JVR0_9ACTN|nr:hypothetical protein [Micromonospora pisi]RKR92668.1 hypothetical protein BDK92_7144 [Micromonospora pisi]